jgi:hypothetical protein
MLRCQARVLRRRKRTGGVETEYHVARVLEHLRGDEQLRLEEPRPEGAETGFVD